MGAVIVGMSLILGLAFLTVFLVELCREGSNMKICRVVRADTEPEATDETRAGEGRVSAPHNDNVRANSSRKVLYMKENSRAQRPLAAIESRIVALNPGSRF